MPSFGLQGLLPLPNFVLLRSQSFLFFGLRAEYEISDLGHPEFQLGGIKFKRTDFQVNSLLPISQFIITAKNGGFFLLS
jgi:hypothetical protein